MWRLAGGKLSWDCVDGGAGLEVDSELRRDQEVFASWLCQTLSISSITADGAIIVCHHKRWGPLRGLGGTSARRLGIDESGRSWKGWRL